jgi:VWFA-related protein
MTVVDRNDTPVMDLTIADVVVREDGNARELKSVGRATAPLQIALLVDDSAASTLLKMDLQKGLTGFVGAISEMNPDTEFTVVTFGERPTTVVPHTTSVSLTTRGIAQIQPRSGAGSYLLQAIIETAKAMKKREVPMAPRANIVAFVAEDGPEFSNDNQQMVADALKAANVSLWTVVLQGRTAASVGTTEQRERASVVGDVAIQSGGNLKTILDKQGITRAFAGVAAQLTSQLDVMYARPDRLIPPTKLEVTVKRPGLKVIAPRWAGQR